RDLLMVSGVVKQFAGRTAVDQVSFTVKAGEVVGLIGPNGAGKTTLFDLISGFIRPDAGQIVFDGSDVSHLRPEQRAQLGLIRSFQYAAFFPTLTACEAVELALERHRPTRRPPSILSISLREERRKAAR